MHVHYTESVVISSESQLKNSVSSNYYTEEFIFHIHVAREARSYGAHLWPMYHSRSFSKDFSYVKMQLHDPVLDLYLSWSEDNVRKVNFCIHLLISSQCDRWYRKDVKVIIDSRQIRQLKAWTACIDKMKNVRDRPDIKHLGSNTNNNSQKSVSIMRRAWIVCNIMRGQYTMHRTWSKRSMSRLCG